MINRRFIPINTKILFEIKIIKEVKKGSSMFDLTNCSVTWGKTKIRRAITTNIEKPITSTG